MAQIFSDIQKTGELRNTSYDVAVIILEVELKFSARISAICLPNPSSQPASNSLTVQGWGKNEEGNSGKGASEVREVLKK